MSDPGGPDRPGSASGGAAGGGAVTDGDAARGDAANGGGAAGGGAAGGGGPAEVHELLARRGETVAVAESLTGGLLAAALTEMPGSSATFRGGLVVYANDLKARLAGVPAPLLDAQGAVSAGVAAALAGGARDRLLATYGVGLTGVAGPDVQDGVPVGTVFLGLATPRGGLVRRLDLGGDRAAIRAAAVAAAVDLLLGHLRDDEGARVTSAARESTA